MSEKNKKKASWTDKQTKYTIGGGLTGLALGVLLRRLIDGSKATSWTDYLLWGGTGAALGSGAGYLAGSEPGLTNYDREVAKARLAEAEVNLADAKDRYERIRKRKGYSRYGYTGNIVKGIAYAGGANALDNSLRALTEIKGKGKGATIIRSIASGVTYAADRIASKKVRNIGYGILAASPVVDQFYNNITDGAWKGVKDDIDKYQDEVDTYKHILGK